jgi:hypothetical protein
MPPVGTRHCQKAIGFAPGVVLPLLLRAAPPWVHIASAGGGYPDVDPCFLSMWGSPHHGSVPPSRLGAHQRGSAPLPRVRAAPTCIRVASVGGGAPMWMCITAVCGGQPAPRSSLGRERRPRRGRCCSAADERERGRQRRRENRGRHCGGRASCGARKRCHGQRKRDWGITTHPEQEGEGHLQKNLSHIYIYIRRRLSRLAWAVGPQLF